MSEEMNVYDDEMSVIHLEMEDGTCVDCAVIAIFEIDEYQQDYIALVPTADLENDEEESELLLYRYHESEDGEVELDNIESDEEYIAVADVFDAILDEEDEDKE